jgi:hypothetical protein
MCEETFVNDFNPIQQLLKERAEMLGKIGTTPGNKAEGNMRLVYESVNGLS